MIMTDLQAAVGTDSIRLIADRVLVGSQIDSDQPPRIPNFGVLDDLGRKLHTVRILAIGRARCDHGRA